MYNSIDISKIIRFTDVMLLTSLVSFVIVYSTQCIALMILVLKDVLLTFARNCIELSVM